MTKQKQLPKIDYDHLENVIIYSMLMDEVYMSSVIDNVRPSYFKNNDIKQIVDIITSFYQKRGTIPSNTEIKTYLTTDELKNSFKNVVNGFKYIDTGLNKEELYENTERFFKEKAVYECVLKTVNDYSENKINTAETLSLFEKACSISLTDNLGHDYFKDIDKHCQDLVKTQQTTSSGWKWLDSKIGGGFLTHGRALYVFAGFTNSGKSIFLGNIAVNALAQNKTVLIISLEMSEEMYAKRISAQITKIPISKLHTQTSDITEKIISYRNEYPNAKLIIKEFPPKSITCNHIKAYIKKLINKGIKPDMIVVDYANLLNAPVQTGNSYEDVKAVSEQLRALSYVFEAPIISATQLNRSSAGVQDPGLELTSESLGLSMTVDAQFSIWTSDQDKELGVIHLGIQKSRFGQNFGTTALKIDYDTLTLSEVDDNFYSTNTVKNTISDLDKMLNGS